MLRRLCTLVFTAIFCFSLQGCVQSIAKNSASVALTEVIDTITDSQQAAQKTALELPASVVIMFLPGKNEAGRNGLPNTTLRQAAEKLRGQLLANQKYINSVAVVSGDYMQSKIPLAQIKAIYGADFLIVLSYEQDQRSYQRGPAALLDFTVVGMFLVPGVETNTTTLVDGKVIHIPNNAMIFRANGMNERTAYSTSYGATSTAAEESIESIQAATTDLGAALSKVLANFEKYDLSHAVPVSVLGAENIADSQERPANDYWTKVNTYKRTGGGAFGMVPVIISLAAAYLARRHK